jgi:glucokinase
MDPTDVAELNSFLVLDAIRGAGSTTRRELSEQLELSDASISRIVRGLLAAGSVEEVEGTGGEMGRTPSLLRFIPRAGSVIAVDLGGTKCHGALADLAGAVLHEDYRLTGGPARAATTVVDCIRSLRGRAEAEGIPVRAVVVGIPALIDPQTGLAAVGPNVGWEGFDLVGTLRAEVHEPLDVDNDANLASLGQAWRGHAIEARSYVTLSLGTGIGGGVVVDGRLVRGLNNAAGEIGLMLMGRRDLRRRESPGRGLERVASGPAVRARAMELVKKSSDSVLAGMDFDTADVFAAAAAGDRVARRVIGELVDHVAVAVVNLAAILDPELVILDGSIGQALEPWLGQLEKKIRPHVFRPPALAISSLGPNATLVGAIGRGLMLASEQDAPAMLRVARSGYAVPTPDGAPDDRAAPAI